MKSDIYPINNPKRNHKIKWNSDYRWREFEISVQFSDFSVQYSDLTTYRFDNFLKVVKYYKSYKSKT